jgi:hypothetical protein
MPNSTTLKNNLAYRLVIYILLFSSLAALFSTTVQLFFEYQRDIGHIETTIEQIRKSHVDTIIPSLWVFDIAMLKTQLQGIKNLPDVRYAGIRKNDGHTLDVGTKTPDDPSLFYEFPLSHSHRGQELQLGTLVVDINAFGIGSSSFLPLRPSKPSSCRSLYFSSFISSSADTLKQWPRLPGR